jgi:hypothetical protein
MKHCCIRGGPIERLNINKYIIWGGLLIELVADVNLRKPCGPDFISEESEEETYLQHNLDRRWLGNADYMRSSKQFERRG